MEEKKRVPWRRWVVLVLLIAGCVLGGGLAEIPSWTGLSRFSYPGFPAVQPEITVAAERLSEEPLFTAPYVGPIYLVNTIPTLVVTIMVIWLLAWATNRSIKRSLGTDLVPRGIGGAMEAFLEIIYNLTETSAGTKWAPLIFPWFATIMIYVLFANLLKLVPGFESIGILHHGGSGHPVQPLGSFLGFQWNLILPGEVEGGSQLVPFVRGISLDLNFTLALAIISVVAIQIVGIRAHGIGYFSKFLNFRTMFKTPFFGPMDFLVGLLELISEISKVLSFAFRLFGNMFAGLVLVAIVASLLGSFSILPAMVMMFELFVGLIQAFVFGMLTMVFMAQATAGHGGEEQHA